MAHDLRGSSFARRERELDAVPDEPGQPDPEVDVLKPQLARPTTPTDNADSTPINTGNRAAWCMLRSPQCGGCIGGNERREAGPIDVEVIAPV